MTKTKNIALLEDRTALRQGKRQTYGSQIGTDPDTGQKYVLPLEDPDNVDKRRFEVGLGSLAEYTGFFDFEWDVEAFKKHLPEIEAKEAARKAEREKKKEQEEKETVKVTDKKVKKKKKRKRRSKHKS